MPGLMCVKMRNREEKWGQYVFDKCRRSRLSSNYKKKTLVTSLGRQRDSDTWVLSHEVQIDGAGSLIPKSEHQYYWDEEHSRESGLKPLRISLPLDEMVGTVA